MKPSFKACRRYKNNFFPTLRLTSKQRTLLKKERKQIVKRYRLELTALQLIRTFYGQISSNAFAKILRTKKDFSSILMQLEQRLDVILVRSQLVPSLALAHVCLNLKKVKVNGKVTTAKGLRLGIGDIFSIETPIDLVIRPHFGLLVNPKPRLPLHLETHFAAKTAIVIRKPQTIGFPYNLPLKDVPVWL